MVRAGYGSTAVRVLGFVALAAFLFLLPLGTESAHAGLLDGAVDSPAEDEATAIDAVTEIVGDDSPEVDPDTSDDENRAESRTRGGLLGGAIDEAVSTVGETALVDGGGESGEVTKSRHRLEDSSGDAGRRSATSEAVAGERATAENSVISTVTRRTDDSALVSRVDHAATSSVTEAVGDVGEAAGDLGDAATSFVTEAGSDVGEAVADLGDAVTDTTSAVDSAVAATVTDTSDLVDAVAGTVNTAAESTTDLAATVVATIEDPIEEGLVEAALDVLQDPAIVVGPVTEVTGDVVDTALDVVASTDGVIEAIEGESVPLPSLLPVTDIVSVGGSETTPVPSPVLPTPGAAPPPAAVDEGPVPSPSGAVPPPPALEPTAGAGAVAGDPHPSAVSAPAPALDVTQGHHDDLLPRRSDRRHGLNPGPSSLSPGSAPVLLFFAILTALGVMAPRSSCWLRSRPVLWRPDTLAMAIDRPG